MYFDHLPPAPSFENIFSQRVYPKKIIFKAFFPVSMSKKLDKGYIFHKISRAKLNCWVIGQNRKLVTPLTEWSEWLSEGHTGSWRSFAPKKKQLKSCLLNLIRRKVGTVHLCRSRADVISILFLRFAVHIVYLLVQNLVQSFTFTSRYIRLFDFV